MSAVVLTSTENLPYEDWLAYRKLGIGGSDASVVCGINRYRSPVELWMNKTGQLPDEEAGETAYWGTRLESLVREEFTRRTGIEVSLVKQILQSNGQPFMLANLDGVCEHPDLGPCIFEAKTASAYKSGEWEFDSIPDEYLLLRWNLSRVFSPISDPVLQFNIRVTGQLYFIYSRIPVPHSSSAGCRIQK